MNKDDGSLKGTQIKPGKHSVSKGRRKDDEERKRFQIFTTEEIRGAEYVVVRSRKIIATGNIFLENLLGAFAL